MKKYTVIVDDANSNLDFEAILEIGLEECDASSNLFYVEEVTLEDKNYAD